MHLSPVSALASATDRGKSSRLSCDFRSSFSIFVVVGSQQTALPRDGDLVPSMRCDATENVSWIRRCLSRDGCLTHCVRTRPDDRRTLCNFLRVSASHSREHHFLLAVGMNMAQPQLESTEAELIKRVCGGEPQAFEELLRPYERLVYATAISILRNPADAEEVAQEAVLKAFSKLSSFRGESRFSTWLVQITYNEARMKLRKERQHLYESIDREQQDQEGEYWPKDFADWRPIPSELLEKRELREALQNGINSLSPMYREIVVLRDVQNLSLKDTAAVLGIPEGSVKTRLHRARLQLRDFLAPGIDGSWSSGQNYRKVRPW